jgi:hypothetical protein
VLVKYMTNFQVQINVHFAGTMENITNSQSKEFSPTKILDALEEPVTASECINIRQQSNSRSQIITQTKRK